MNRLQILRSLIATPSESCIEFPFSLSRGYGNLKYRGKQWKASRVAYRETYGEFDLKLFVLHTCDNRLCINPKHLYLGTHKENNQDKARRATIVLSPIDKQWIREQAELGRTVRSIADELDESPQLVRWTIKKAIL